MRSVEEKYCSSNVNKNARIISNSYLIHEEGSIVIDDE